MIHVVYFSYISQLKSDFYSSNSITNKSISQLLPVWQHLKSVNPCYSNFINVFSVVLTDMTAHF